jgi:murein DD-endopeptidase MepM/ murein hydrolase activator NlpD
VPAPGETVVPLLRAPFDGAYGLRNYFDHDLPFEFTDTNGFQLNHAGGRYGGIDGHNGYDWPMPEGTPLLAAAAGQVTRAGQNPPFVCPILNNQSVQANEVDIRVTAPNGDVYVLIYQHLSRIDVQNGATVSEGQQIGLSGNTGCSTGPHLHFGVRRTTRTNNGMPALVDPYGWAAGFPDPWALDSRGASSVWLWKDGQAPPLFQRRTLAPNTGGSTARVTLTTVQWGAANDTQNPNEDFVELTADPAFAPAGGVDLSAYQLKNTGGSVYRFPAGTMITSGQPIRLYGGTGTDTATSLHWGLSGPAWNALGDCAQLVSPSGGVYRLGFGATQNCTAPPALTPSVWQVSPFSGTAGTAVTITGACFNGATAVVLGGTPAASFTVVSDTQITAVADAGSGSGTVTVTGPSGASQTRPQVTFGYGG